MWLIKLYIFLFGPKQRNIRRGFRNIMGYISAVESMDEIDPLWETITAFHTHYSRYADVEAMCSVLYRTLYEKEKALVHQNVSAIVNRRK